MNTGILIVSLFCFIKIFTSIYWVGFVISLLCCLYLYFYMALLYIIFFSESGEWTMANSLRRRYTTDAHVQHHKTETIMETASYFNGKTQQYKLRHMNRNNSLNICFCCTCEATYKLQLLLHAHRLKVTNQFENHPLKSPISCPATQRANKRLSKTRKASRNNSIELDWDGNVISNRPFSLSQSHSAQYTEHYQPMQACASPSPSTEMRTHPSFESTTIEYNDDLSDSSTTNNDVSPPPPLPLTLQTGHASRSEPHPKNQRYTNPFTTVDVDEDDDEDGDEYEQTCNLELVSRKTIHAQNERKRKKRNTFNNQTSSKKQVDKMPHFLRPAQSVTVSHHHHHMAKQKKKKTKSRRNSYSRSPTGQKAQHPMSKTPRNHMSNYRKNSIETKRKKSKTKTKAKK